MPVHSEQVLTWLQCKVPGSGAWQRVLYLDLDVWCAQPLQPFLEAAATAAQGSAAANAMARAQARSRAAQLATAASPAPGRGAAGAAGAAAAVHAPWLVLFWDCGAHALGWCRGCDRWNTGVMVVARPATFAADGHAGYAGTAGSAGSGGSGGCLAAWQGLLEAGAFPTDQVDRPFLPLPLRESHPCGFLLGL